MISRPLPISSERWSEDGVQGGWWSKRPSAGAKAWAQGQQGGDSGLGGDSGETRERLPAQFHTMQDGTNIPKRLVLPGLSRACLDIPRRIAARKTSETRAIRVDDGHARPALAAFKQERRCRSSRVLFPPPYQHLQGEGRAVQDPIGPAELPTMSPLLSPSWTPRKTQPRPSIVAVQGVASSRGGVRGIPSRGLRAIPHVLAWLLAS